MCFNFELAIKAIMGAICTNTTPWTDVSHSEFLLGTIMAIVYFQATYFLIHWSGQDPRQTEIWGNWAQRWPTKVILGAKCTYKTSWTCLSCSKVQLGTIMATQEYKWSHVSRKSLISTTSNLWAHGRVWWNFWASKVSLSGCFSAVSTKNPLDWPSQLPFFTNLPVCPEGRKSGRAYNRL